MTLASPMTWMCCVCARSFRNADSFVGSVVVTHYNGQSSADAFRQRLERLGITTYYHYTIEGYPTNVDLIDSDDGFGRNDYVETSRPLVIVTAPGPGSGKMAVCLSQLYNEHKRGIEAGYAKFETFPVWSLPLKHPVNIAYEAATADLNDVNMIDPFHLEAYGKTAINYNRDIEIFPVLNALFEGIYGENPYKSPTDMGVNMVGFCINDDEVCCRASKDEIIRRYYTALNRFAQGTTMKVRSTRLPFFSSRPRSTPLIAARRLLPAKEPSVAVCRVRPSNLPTELLSQLRQALCSDRAQLSYSMP